MKAYLTIMFYEDGIGQTKRYVINKAVYKKAGVAKEAVLSLVEEGWKVFPHFNSVSVKIIEVAVLNERPPPEARRMGQSLSTVYDQTFKRNPKPEGT